MGECNGLTIERRDPNGNYCKANCCWIPKAAQRRNTRHTHQIEWNGETKPLDYWAKDLGISGTALKYRIAKWGLERAMTKSALESWHESSLNRWTGERPARVER